MFFDVFYVLLLKYLKNKWITTTKNTCIELLSCILFCMERVSQFEMQSMFPSKMIQYFIVFNVILLKY